VKIIIEALYPTVTASKYGELAATLAVISYSSVLVRPVSSKGPQYEDMREIIDPVVSALFRIQEEQQGRPLGEDIQ
jgi:hypothetical protein